MGLLEDFYAGQPIPRATRTAGSAGPAVRRAAGRSGHSLDGVEVLSEGEKALLYGKMQVTVAAVRVGIVQARVKTLARPNEWVAAALTAASGWLSPVLAAVVPGFSTSSHTKAAVLDALGTMENILAARERSIPEVLAGQVDAKRWFAAVDEIKNGTKAILKTLDEMSISNVVEANATDARKAVEGILVKMGALPGIFDKYGVVAVVAAVALGALVLVPVAQAYLKAPLRAVGGVDGRRRRRRRQVRLLLP